MRTIRLNGCKIPYCRSNCKYINAYMNTEGIMYRYTDAVDENAVFSFQPYGNLYLPNYFLTSLNIGDTVTVSDRLDGVFVPLSIPSSFISSLAALKEIPFIKGNKRNKKEKKWNGKSEIHASKWAGPYVVEVYTKGATYMRIRPANEDIFSGQDLLSLYGRGFKNCPLRNFSYKVQSLNHVIIPECFRQKADCCNLIMYTDDKEMLICENSTEFDGLKEEIYRGYTLRVS